MLTVVEWTFAILKRKCEHCGLWQRQHCVLLSSLPRVEVVLAACLFGTNFGASKAADEAAAISSRERCEQEEQRQSYRVL